MAMLCGSACFEYILTYIDLNHTRHQVILTRSAGEADLKLKFLQCLRSIGTEPEKVKKPPILDINIFMKYTLPQYQSCKTISLMKCQLLY